MSASKTRKPAPVADFYFGGPSPLLPDNSISGKEPSQAQQELLAKLKTARECVIGVRKYVETTAAGRKALTSRKSLEEINALIIDELTSDPEGCPNEEARKHIEGFKALVPTVLPDQTAALIIAQDVGATALHVGMGRYEEGSVDDAWMKRVIETLSKMNSIPIPKGGSIEKDAAFLLEELHKKEGEGARWVPRGHGAENRVYTGENGLVYKLCPIKEHILDIPEVKKGDPLYPRPCSYPMAGPNGRVPLLDRLIHANTIPGMALADMVGLTPQGVAIFKQVDLGDKEPDMDKLADWVSARDLKPLAPEEEDPTGQIASDSSLMPIVWLAEGKPILALDLNPRNCRAFQGQTVPFDIVSRELSDKEVQRNPKIKAAVDELLLEQGVPPGKLRKLNGPSTGPALAGHEL